MIILLNKKIHLSGMKILFLLLAVGCFSVGVHSLVVGKFLGAVAKTVTKTAWKKSEPLLKKVDEIRVQKESWADAPYDALFGGGNNVAGGLSISARSRKEMVPVAINVSPEQANAEIFLMNLPKDVQYEKGIRIAKGSDLDIMIMAEGYYTKRFWASDVTSENNRINVQLKQKSEVSCNIDTYKVWGEPFLGDEVVIRIEQDIYDVSVSEMYFSVMYDPRNADVVVEDMNSFIDGHYAFANYKQPIGDVMPFQEFQKMLGHRKEMVEKMGEPHTPRLPEYKDYSEFTLGFERLPGESGMSHVRVIQVLQVPWPLSYVAGSPEGEQQFRREFCDWIEENNNA